MLSASLNTSDLAKLESDTFNYFLHEMHPETGLVPDSTRENSPSSIAVIGFALTVYPIAVERSYLSRAEAIKRTLRKLRFFYHGPDGEGPDAIGCKGFYYHFLDMNTGRRVWNSEVSTMDTAILIAGALTAAQYFNRDTAAEREIRKLADELYRRADWQWARNGGETVTHGWKPETGFIKYRWTGYNEALILYILALASPTFPVSPENYRAWTETYKWKSIYGFQYLFAGPLFIHQLSHMWIDFRGIQDDYMSHKAIDYFENSRRATYVNQQYAIRNPKALRDYGQYTWGITASNGPGPTTRRVRGITRRFLGYAARGVPYGPDDGTLAPFAVVASLPFAPEIVIPTLEHCSREYPHMENEYGLVCSFNPTFPNRSSGRSGWISKDHFALDQGSVILMIENYRSGLIWRLTRSCPYVVTGLRHAGFRGDWL